MSTTTDTTTDTNTPAQDGSLLGDRVIAAIVIVLGAVVLILAFGFPSRDNRRTRGPLPCPASSAEPWSSWA